MPVIKPSLAQWDEFISQQRDAHILQLSAWGELKRDFGWTVDRIALTDDQNRITAGAQLLFRPLPLRLGQLAYLAMGPYGNKPGLWDVIDRCARDHGAAFLKWEPGIVNVSPDFAALGFRESPQTIQPPRTVLIDISGNDDDIMQRMNQGTRRKIRKSLKSDIEYRTLDRAELPQFTAMMTTTGSRNNFGVHSASYYERAYDLFVPDQAAVIMAVHEGDPLASIFVFGAGSQAWYLYGASSSIKRNLMATYGVQWAAIQWARERGYAQYDMWGVPDEDLDVLEAQFQEREDGLWGVYGFKRGWGGELVRSEGAWDKVYQPLIYAAYRAALRLRA